MDLRSLPTTILSCVFVLLLAPFFANAVLNDGDKMCVPADPDPCICSPKMVPGKGCVGAPNKFMCDCKDTTGGFTTMGKCVATLNCKGNSTSDGKSLGDLKGVMDLAKSLMDALKPKPKGGGGDMPMMPPAGGSGYGNLYPPCVQNPATGTLSPIPCIKSDGSIAYSASEGSGVFDYFDEGSGTSDSLLDILQGGSGEDGVGDEGVDTEDTSSTTPEVPDGEVSTLKPGTAGDIIIGDSGVTVVGNTRTEDTEVAGFYGVPSESRLQAKSVIGRLCSTRPWAGGFLAAIVPPEFFDGLCQWGGYQVGVVEFQSGGATKTGTNTFVAPPDTPKKGAPKIQEGTPEVDIWAEPDRVRLGSRTYIFWNTKNVESCEALGPSFEQRSFSGGASTVPITDSSTFTLVCMTADGQEVRDEITVELAI